MIADEVRRFGLKMNMCIRDMGLRLSVDDRETETSILFFFRALLIMSFADLQGNDKSSESIIQRESHSLKNDVNDIYSKSIGISWL